jgi:hypothetical protein
MDEKQCQTEGVFIAREVSQRYSNGCCFDSCMPTRVRCIENRVSCTSYPDGQANCLTFQRKIHRDVMAVQQWTRVLQTRQCGLNTSSTQYIIG